MKPFIADTRLVNWLAVYKYTCVPTHRHACGSTHTHRNMYICNDISSVSKCIFKRKRKYDSMIFKSSSKEMSLIDLQLVVLVSPRPISVRNPVLNFHISQKKAVFWEGVKEMSGKYLIPTSFFTWFLLLLSTCLSWEFIVPGTYPVHLLDLELGLWNTIQFLHIAWNGNYALHLEKALPWEDMILSV